MTVFVIAGGLSHEREVSLRSGKRLAGALRKRGHAVTETDVNADLISRLLGDEGPVAIPVLHGELGEDGALREVLWMLGVPFVGSDGASSRRTFDKSVATRLVGADGLATPQQVALPDDVFRERSDRRRRAPHGCSRGRRRHGRRWTPASAPDACRSRRYRRA